MHQIIPWLKRHRASGVAATALLLGCLSLGPALADGAAAAGSPVTYTYTQVNNQNNVFNQLLGINDQQVIAGYMGSGSTANPNKGYTVLPPYSQSNFRHENFPGSVQTQVTGINDSGVTVGFYVNTAMANVGFVHTSSGFVSVTDPNTTSSPAFNQLLGVNNNGLTVGFYEDSTGASHPYIYNVATMTFSPVPVPAGVTSAFASGINDQNDVVGTETLKSGATHGFVIVNGVFSTLAIRNKVSPPATNVSVFGVNDLLQIVGFYTDATGATHGFVDNNGTPVVINEPAANGFTVVNGINNGGELVGFYDTTAGDNCVNTCKGFVAVPSPY